MNIKEIESKSGLSRANIRFYENEGLLSPARKDNGYRDYSEENLELLKKIRLMRELGISLDQIKQLQYNPDALSRLMKQRMEAIEREKREMDDRKTVCAEIHTTGISFDRLEAERYLKRLEALAYEQKSGNLSSYQQVVKTDEEPFVPHPWKRYLARTIDLTLCNVLWSVIWELGLGQLALNGVFGPVIDTIMGLALLLLIEPVCLACFGTTIGKWIFGISVYSQDGSRLKWKDALTRTWLVLLRGMGLTIPGYELYRLYRSRKDYVAGWTLEWDQDIEYQIHNCAVWKTAGGLIVAGAVLFGSTFLLYRNQFLPVNQGELTVAEFAENYNHYVKVLNAGADIAETAFLKENGEFVTSEELEWQGIYIIDMSAEPVLELRYHKNGEYLTGISFEQNIVSDFIVHGYQSEMIYSILAFVGAEEEYSIWNQEILHLVEKMKEVGLKDFEMNIAGVHISCDVETKNLWDAGDMMIAEEGKTGEMTVVFEMKKEIDK